MAKSITVRLPNGKMHTYENVPDNVTQEEAQERAMREFGSGAIRAGSPEAAALTHGATAAPSEARGPTPFTVDKKTGAMRPLSGMEKFTYGFGLGTRNIGLNVAEMLGMTSPERVREAQAEAAPITEKFPGNVGAFTGETAALFPVGMGTAGLATRVGLPARGVLAGTVEGATQGAVAAGPDNRLEGTLSGAAFGAGFPTARQMVKTLGRGLPMSKEARLLTGRGVELTPGQINPEGSWAMLEEVLQSVPVIGPKIRAARGQGWTQTQNVIAQEAAPPGVTMPPRSNPQAMFQDLADAYDQAYQVGKGYPMLPVVRPATGPDVPLYAAMKIPKNADASDEAKTIASRFIDDEFSTIRGKGAKLQSDDLLKMRSRIRAKIRELISNPKAPYGAETLLENAEKKITAALDSQLPSDVVNQIRAIDAKYGNFKVLQDALTRTSKVGFTPYNFSMAVRESAPSDMSYALGGGRMRDISSAASNVFEPRQPMTGRQIIPVAAAGGTAVLGGPLTQVAGAGMLGAGMLPYMQNRIGQVARQALTGRTDVQQAIRDAERAARRTLTPREREQLIRFLQTMGVAGTSEQE